MADLSNISWTDSTHNPWLICSHKKLRQPTSLKMVLDEACRNCYAFTTTVERHKWGEWGDGADRIETKLNTRNRPLAWYRKAIVEKRRHVVFCASLSDWLDDHKSITQDMRNHLYALIETTAPNADGYGLYWLMLTKRLENFEKLAPPSWVEQGVPEHVMIGQTITTQLAANERFPLFGEIRAKHKFVSFEPLTHPVDISEHINCTNCKGNGCSHCYGTGLSFNWGIIGGESDMWRRDNVRPCYPHHVRPLIQQMEKHGIVPHFKQWGDLYPLEQLVYNPTPTRELVKAQERGGVVYWGDGINGERPFINVGKKVAGRLVDGVLYDNFPDVISQDKRVPQGA